jgi:asparagine synthase (glutamine-hydrolysing)
MCGLAGIRNYDDGPVDTAALMRMREKMRTRGPDGEALWLDPDGGLGIAHRRLAIIDLSERGAQPMATPDGRYHVGFNGEIYNYPELRAWCEGHGVRFSSDSDTEVLLHLYALEGHDFVQRLRGMFAFALWDRQERTLLLARDPFGIKPLYYADDGKRLQFASQVKALLAGGQVDTTQDPAGIVSFFLWGYVTEPNTLFRAVRALPAGSTLVVRSGQRPSVQAYHDPLDALRAPVIASVDKQLLREATLDSVSHHLLADVPMGLFLSAGIDSGTMLALASECTDGKALRAVTLGFSEFAGTDNDEVPLARLCADRYGCAQDVHVIGRDSFTAERLRIIEHMDQPTVDAVNTYLVSQAAAGEGLKVAISGLGGDELFGGYPSFRQVPRMAQWLGWVPSGLGRGVRQLVAPLVYGRTSPKYAGLFEYGNTIEGAYLLRRALFMPWELPEVLEPEIAAAGLRELDVMAVLQRLTAGIADPYRRVMALEYGIYLKNCLLRDADWAGMAHSLEIRTPLVDTLLFAAVGAPQGLESRPLQKSDLAATPARPLPKQILNRRKTGFSVPVQKWLAAESSAYGDRGLRGWARFLAIQFGIDGLRFMAPEPSPAARTG